MVLEAHTGVIQFLEVFWRIREPTLLRRADLADAAFLLPRGDPLFSLASRRLVWDSGSVHGLFCTSQEGSCGQGQGPVKKPTGPIGKVVRVVAFLHRLLKDGGSLDFLP